MAESEATSGFGILLKRGDGATPEVFTSIAEITSLTPPQLSQDEVEVTHHESPERWREFIPTLKDGGEISGELNWLPNHPTQNNTTGLLKVLNNGEISNWQIVIPSLPPATWTVKGFMTAYNPAATPTDGKLSVSFTIRTTGKPTLT